MFLNHVLQSPFQIENYQVQAVGDFDGEEKGDLGFKEGEILTILSAR